MKAYMDDPKLKRKLIGQIRAHRKAEQLVKGTYWQGNGDGRGCAVGCLTHDPSGGHAKYETDWGIPEVLARLEDAIFEALPEADAQKWPERFLSAIQPGADLRPVWHRFAAETLREDLLTLRAVKDCNDVLKAVKDVAKLHERAAAGKRVTKEQWARAAERASWASWAAEAAEAAARASWAAEAAERAARASARASWAAGAEAEEEAWKKMADRLIRLLEAA